MTIQKIPFNKPYLSGKELYYISQTIHSGQTSGNQFFTKKCHNFFSEKYGFDHCLLTTSCTDALEMAALLINIKEGDEVIMPSFTFVSTANAFVLRGAKIVFADSYRNNPNIDAGSIENLITDRTKAIVVVHYAGVACDMSMILEIAQKYNLYVIEDAAQSIDSFYRNKPLGSIGDLSTFSFHQTKNLISGEGGLLVINREKFVERAEIIWEKGTNRAAFFRGEVDKYSWVDIGSSFLPSDITAAFLFAQLENMDQIQEKRKMIWNYYKSNLTELEKTNLIALPDVPEYATVNGHLFYILCRNLNERTQLIEFLKSRKIHAVFHYLSLHKSEFYKSKHGDRPLPNCDRFADTLVRLPLFYELSLDNLDYIIDSIFQFFSSRK